MDASSSISVRQVLGGFCLGFGVATYLLGAIAYVWLSQMFIVGISNRLAFWGTALFPGLLMLIGILSIVNSRKKR